jgi:hypothetical protein
MTNGVVLFGIAMHKPDFPRISPIQRTCEEMAGHFDAYLQTIEIAQEKQRGLMIFDQSRHEKTVQSSTNAISDNRGELRYSAPFG